MIDKAKRQAVFDKFDGRCSYCGKGITRKSFQVDHFIPKLSGGTDELENLMPACRSCNGYKSSYTLEWFRANIQSATDVQRSSNSMFRLLERYGIVKQVKTEVVFHFEKAGKS